MIQDQLVDYISSQMKLGVSREAVKSALVGAGWVSADIEDTLRKVEGTVSVQPAVAVTAGIGTSASGGSGNQRPASSAFSGSGAGFSSSQNPQASSTQKPGGGGPQMLRVSDLISGTTGGSTVRTSSASPMSSPSFGGDSGSKSMRDIAKTDSSHVVAGGKVSDNTFEAATMKSHGGGGKGMAIVAIICGILALAFAGGAWYFYSSNAALAAKVTSLTSDSAGINSQLTTLQSQFAASSTNLLLQVASLTAENANLALELSFYVPGSSGSTPTPISLTGMISGGVGKAPYQLMTSDNAKIVILNSSDAKTAAALKPLVGQTATVSGTYIQGSDGITVTAVNGSNPDMVVATGTAMTGAASSTP